jgi:hypothetical protein
MNESKLEIPIGKVRNQLNQLMWFTASTKSLSALVSASGRGTVLEYCQHVRQQRRIHLPRAQTRTQPEEHIQGDRQEDQPHVRRDHIKAES